MTTHYLSSKGPVVIATMPGRYAANALARLEREAPERAEEIKALREHLDNLPDDVPMVAKDDNAPSEPVLGWEAVKLDMDDLLDQVQGVTGIEIKDQTQADTIAKLLRDVQKSAKAADEARIAEKKPFDDAADEVQTRFNAYIAPIKNKKPGSMSKAEQALKNQMAAWLRKLDDEKRERERIAKAKADALEEEARQAHLAAKVSDDLDVIEAAEALMEAAQDAGKELKQVARESSAVKVEGARAVGLRSKWVAVLDKGGGSKALMHYAKAQPDLVIAFLQGLADKDVAAGVRMLPGFTIKEERVL